MSSMAAETPTPALQPTVFSDPASAYRALAVALHRYVSVRLRADEAAVDDVMQQLWLEANRPRPAHGVADAEAWLRGVARNLIRRHWRSQWRLRRVRPIADPVIAADLAARMDAEPLPPELLLRAEIREQILLALTTLRAEDQELIVQAHFRGWSHEQIAAANNASARAIEGRLYRARRALRDALAHLDPNEAS